MSKARSLRLASFTAPGWQLARSAILQSGSPINVTTGGTYPRGDLNREKGEKAFVPSPFRLDTELYLPTVSHCLVFADFRMASVT